MTRYIFVTGGVLSSLGKGVTAASLGTLLKSRGFKVRIRKFEPYLNVDPGTMSPYQHGEVYVTDDGAETDLDLGHYERFTQIPTRRSDAVSTGQVYSYVINKERRGDYLGATVQVIPHITDAIKEFITRDLDPDLDFLICEIGGTVGDIESLPFLEAIRQFSNDVRRDNILFLHVTLVPYIKAAAELKTKPSQHSVKELQHVGIQPDMLVCRSEYSLPQDLRAKLALFCNIRPEYVFEALDVPSIYEIPLRYSAQSLDAHVLEYFKMDAAQAPSDIQAWKDLHERMAHPKDKVRIALVGKYVGLQDAYKSLSEALSHAATQHSLKLEIDWVPAEELTDDAATQARLSQSSAVLVPGGYGERGIPGKLRAITYARTKKVPFLGICLGMQMAVVEAARNLLQLPLASSTEFGTTPEPVVSLLTEWEKEGHLERRTSEDELGGTMRLGSYPCRIQEGSLAEKIYGKTLVTERHRHRYEVNPNYQAALADVGVIFSGMSLDDKLPELLELKNHPWFFATQAHPEFKSTVLKPHPIFLSFIKAAYAYQQQQKE